MFIKILLNGRGDDGIFLEVETDLDFDDKMPHQLFDFIDRKFIKMKYPEHGIFILKSSHIKDFIDLCEQFNPVFQIKPIDEQKYISQYTIAITSLRHLKAVFSAIQEKAHFSNHDQLYSIKPDAFLKIKQMHPDLPAWQKPVSVIKNGKLVSIENSDLFQQSTFSLDSDEEKDTDYDYRFHIKLMGDAGTGKSTLVRRYLTGAYHPGSSDHTQKNRF